MKKAIDIQAQKAMQKALEAYKKEKNSAKEFLSCSEELSQWMQNKAKK